MSRQLTLRIPGTPFSRRLDRRILILAAAGLALTMAIAGYRLTLGDAPIPVTELWGALTGHGSASTEFIVRQLRLPRVAVAVLAGAAMGLSGALLQSLARNPLVAPDIIGVNAGAALVAVAVLTVYTGYRGALEVGAFTGAIAAAALVYLAAQQRGRLQPYRLVLIGIGVDAACRAGISFLLVAVESMPAQAAVLWMVGSLAGVGPGDAWFLLVMLLLLTPVVVAVRRPLMNLQLGEDTAQVLGTRTGPVRLTVLIVAVLLAASAVAICGPVAFVAFIAPHLARRIARAPGAAVLGIAALIGALLFLLADLVALHLLPVPLPLGVITPLIGGPYFLYLLLRMSRTEAT
ncbi:iron chelate uptake ABC transporter family permease subunit [Natronosporangium hydrolyticum]|uniref:Iron chelate uptake ABC transporter family permease subunit n=1 Tax=Natronosporangium hydrolyticum TaxID=2811111 RepID=A0A895YB62_9ACTN|nr:iron chelate uptake ABC transporter family permease subunit [Natronosporangium hydrolyticum]QSB14651.1 iron chelate uptake ABC transporter family permease subunit [Natronosporangium hydrolyticum]